MIERPRSRPSWTPSASEKPLFSVLSEGGPASIVFAARRPERTRALILYGTFPFVGFGWDDVDRDPAEVRARLLPELGEDYTPSTSSSPASQEFGRAVRSAWGSGAALKCLAAVGPVDTPARNVGAHERQPGDGAGDNRSDVPDRRPADPADDHRANPGHPCPRGPRLPVQCGRYLADHIPGAQ